MYFFRRFIILLALSAPALQVLEAQDSTSSSAQPGQEQTQQPATAGETQGQLSVQARIRARREQRRAQAIHDTYSHLYEAFVGAGYLRFTPGPKLQRVTLYSWNLGVTRYYGERLGATVEGRGYYGTPFVYPNVNGGSSLTKPAISQYDVMGGPTYRFYLRPSAFICG